MRENKLPLSNLFCRVCVNNNNILFAKAIKQNFPEVRCTNQFFCPPLPQFLTNCKYFKIMCYNMFVIGETGSVYSGLSNTPMKTCIMHYLPIVIKSCTLLNSICLNIWLQHRIIYHLRFNVLFKITWLSDNFCRHDFFIKLIAGH